MTVQPPPPNETVIGEVFLDDFDHGVVRTLGGELTPYEVEGKTRSTYAVQVPGVVGLQELGGRVPFQWINPEDVFQPYKLPSFGVKRSDFEFDFQGQSWWGIQARGPKPGLAPITVTSGGKTATGYSNYIVQARGSPCRIPYEVAAVARTSHEALFMLKYIMRICLPPYFVVEVRDSKGELRTYDAGPVTASDVSDLLEIQRRKSGHMIRFEVVGELDLFGAHESVALTTVPVIEYNMA